MPASPPSSTEPLPERIAVGVTLLLLLLGLASRAVGWDWLFDTAFLVAGGWLALGRAGPRALLVCGYLLLDAGLRLLVFLCYPGLATPFWLALTGLYAVAFARRLRVAGVALPWAALSAPPARWLTAAALVPLACLYLPMLHFYHPAHAVMPPMIVTVGYVTTMGPATPIDLGAELTYRGVQVALARGAGLLLAGTVLGRLLAAAGLVSAASARRFAQAAAVGVAVWWLLPARGWHSLDNPYDLLFLAGLATLLVLLFRAPAASTATETRA